MPIFRPATFRLATFATLTSALASTVMLTSLVALPSAAQAQSTEPVRVGLLSTLSGPGADAAFGARLAEWLGAQRQG